MTKKRKDYETLYEERTEKLLNYLGKKGKKMPYDDIMKIEDDIFTEKISSKKDIDEALKKYKK
jgi:hypothetical protein